MHWLVRPAWLVDVSLRWSVGKAGHLPVKYHRDWSIASLSYAGAGDIMCLLHFWYMYTTTTHVDFAMIWYMHVWQRKILCICTRALCKFHTIYMFPLVGEALECSHKDTHIEIARLWQGCERVVTRLWEGCGKDVTRLWEGCYKITNMHLELISHVWLHCKTYCIIGIFHRGCNLHIFHGRVGSTKINMWNLWLVSMYLYRQLCHWNPSLPALTQFSAKSQSFLE